MGNELSKEKATPLAKEEAKEQPVVDTSDVQQEEQKPEKEKEAEKKPEERPTSKPLGRRRSNTLPARVSASKEDSKKDDAEKKSSTWKAAKKPDAKASEESKKVTIGEKKSKAEDADDVAAKKADEAKENYNRIVNWSKVMEVYDKKHLYLGTLELYKKYLEQLDEYYAVPKDRVTGGSPKQVQSMQMIKLYSLQARTELAKAEASMDRVKQAKSDFREDLTNNPMILKMLLHVGEVNSSTKDAARGLVMQEKGSDKLSEEEIQKRTWEMMNDPRKGALVGNIGKEDSKTSKNLKHTGKFFEALLELYNNVMGVFGDMGDATESKSKISQDLLDKYGDGKWKHPKWSKKDDMPETSDYLSAGGAFVGLILKIVETYKGFSEAGENKEFADKQERSGAFSDNVFNVLDCLSSVMDVASNFTDWIPFLNTIMGLAQNAITIVKSCIEVHGARANKKQISGSKEKLKKRMADKRRKYAGLKEEAFFQLDELDEKSIRHKKDELMADAMNTVGGSKRSTDENNIMKNGKKHHFHNFWDTMFHTKDKEVWDQGNGDVTERMQDSMEAMRKAHRERMSKPDEVSPGEERIYKVKMRRLEAIQLLQDYEMELASEHKSNVKLGHSGFELGTALGKLICNGVELAGEITAAFGGAGGALYAGAKAGKAAIGIAETAKFLGGKANGHFERHSQRGLNKKFHRNEMAISLCERMAAFGNNYSEGGAYDDLVSGDKIKENIEDRQIIHMQREFEFLRDLRQTSDMKVSSILKADKRSDIVDSLSNIFSQEGN